MKRKAETERNVAENMAEITKVKGKTEEDRTSLIKERRDHEVELEKIAILKKLAANPDVAVYGNYKDNIVAMLAANKLGLSL